MFCGSEVACYKSNTAKMLRGEPFCPETYVLPAEREQLLAAEKRARARKEPCYWMRNTVFVGGVIGVKLQCCVQMSVFTGVYSWLS